MTKSKKHFVAAFVLAAGCLIIGGVFAFTRYLPTEKTLTQDFSRSVSSVYKENQFYVRNNVMYLGDYGLGDHICSVENHWIRRFAEKPSGDYKSFSVLEDGTVIIQKRDAFYLLNKTNGTLTLLSEGVFACCEGNKAYFIKDSTLYSALTDGTEQEAVLTFDELLAAYSDAVVYRNAEGIFQLLLDGTKEPKLLVRGEIPWEEGSEPWRWDTEYLYTSDYALRISDKEIDMFTYSTGELKRIYDGGTSGIIMTVSARENELYVSRQLVDIKFFPLSNKEINGTYRYNFTDGTWEMLTENTFGYIAQFDDEHLYGADVYGIGSYIKGISVK